MKPEVENQKKNVAHQAKTLPKLKTCTVRIWFIILLVCFQLAILIYYVSSEHNLGEFFQISAIYQKESVELQKEMKQTNATLMTHFNLTAEAEKIQNKSKDNTSTFDAVKIKISEDHETILPNCSEIPNNLQGRLNISFNHPPQSFEETFAKNPLLGPGGHGKPSDCQAKWKVAIVIPYRNRLEHLKYFVQYMHPTLQRQQVDYQIFLINQMGNGKFNRAKLMNIGFLEAKKLYPFQCFSFHDVDLILEDDRSLYWCSDRPRHMSAAVDKHKYVLPYSSIFGGVTLLSTKQMEDINGFSNSFWGWGGEDDDVFNRLRIKGYKIIRYPMNIARYKMIVHKRDQGNEANPKRFSMIRKTKETINSDGINNIDYQVYSIEYHPTYTNITVDIKGPG